MRGFTLSFSLSPFFFSLSFYLYLFIFIIPWARHRSNDRQQKDSKRKKGKSRATKTRTHRGRRRGRKMKVTRRPFSENKPPSIGHRVSITAQTSVFPKMNSKNSLPLFCAYCVRQNPDNEIPIKKIVGWNGKINSDTTAIRPLYIIGVLDDWMKYYSRDSSIKSNKKNECHYN